VGKRKKRGKGRSRTSRGLPDGEADRAAAAAAEDSPSDPEGPPAVGAGKGSSTVKRADRDPPEAYCEEARRVRPEPDGAAELPMWEWTGDIGRLIEAYKTQRALLVKRTIRSGQRVSYDGHLVVIGDVNPGAEILASGDIVVMGSMRGMAHAGATGRSESVIVAFRLDPTQLRIAHLVSRPPEGESALDRPEVARVRDGTIVIEGLGQHTRKRAAPDDGVGRPDEEEPGHG